MEDITHCTALPESLVRLECYLVDVAGPCKLGQLTARRDLDSPDRAWDAGDVPPNLEVIDIPIHNAEVLRPLECLRQVKTWMWAEDVVALASYPCAVSGALTHVWVEHSVDSDAHGGNDVGQDLPDGGVEALVEGLVSSGAVKFLRELHLTAPWAHSLA